MRPFPNRLAFAALLMAVPLRIEAAPPARVELAYPSHLQARIVAHGRTYVATLEPLPDAWRDLSMFRLNLVRVGDRRARNLISAWGHGFGPEYFDAADLAAQSGGTSFPNPRRIELQGMRDALVVTILDRRVHPTRTEMHDAFDGLRLSLAIRRGGED